MASIRLLGIAGSLRQASTNRGLLRAAQANLPAGASLEIVDLTDIPFYNQDIAEKPAAGSDRAKRYSAANCSGSAYPSGRFPPSCTRERVKIHATVAKNAETCAGDILRRWSARLPVALKLGSTM